jgi:hypothetical protein
MHRLQSGDHIRAEQDQSDMIKTMTYRHVLNRGERGGRSPLDEM